ncbi:MAG TPA: nitrite/sulfite reductase [Chthonomonadaceae bacterium]|nr:nitrite/sulfite reductase [Chthonomonadaceae bacterium]
MKVSNGEWRARLLGKMPPALAEEIDIFETEIALKKQGKMDDKVFAETRLRRGAYGQRYDSGQRHDGRVERTLNYPSNGLTKGPNTLWDAPGMQRIKVPFGGLNATRLEVLADLAEEYSDGIAHITTRQDFQLHFVHIEDTPSLMRRLAVENITTREACGNSVRNVTACPLAGVCRTQVFDVTPYADVLMRFLLGHPDTMEFGRKFKPAFSGCRDEACGLVKMHDIGFVAAVRDVDGQPQRGFEVYIGGGLGAVPYQAKVLYEFLPMEEMLPMTQAVARVYGRLGEKRNRQKARIKFLIQKLGLEEFKRLVEEERKVLPYDPRWTSWLNDIDRFEEAPLRPSGLVQVTEAPPPGYRQWHQTNVYPQRQPGYNVVTVALPLGDITATQLRALADIARKYVKETVRTTVEQNILLRWVRDEDLIAVYKELKAVKLDAAGAGTVVDLVACPGTDTCKLGISSSRGLGAELRSRMLARYETLDPAVRNLRIKVSGCFNSCGQHHVADLGFYGVSRNKDGYTVPHFQVILGGQWNENAGSYGLAVGAVPAKNIPAVVDRITDRFLADRQSDESFQQFIQRIGKAELKTLFEDLMTIPSHDVDPSYYTDWGDAREYTIGDMGVGECAGEVVSPTEFALTASEREVFEAQLLLDKGDYAQAVRRAYDAMVRGATGLLLHLRLPVSDDPDAVVRAFRTHFFDTELFFDPFRGGSQAQYFFDAHETVATRDSFSQEATHQLIEEAQLFLEGCQSCYMRLITRK